MPVNSYSVGKDLSFTLLGPNGKVTLNGVTEYSTKPMFTNLDSKLLNGKHMFAAIPDGWEVSIRVDRQDPVLDDFFASLETAYYNGQNISNGTILETIQEVDGSVSQYQYIDVSLIYNDAGSYKGDSLVQIALPARPSRRNKIA